MVEGRVVPRRGVVALLTGRREPGLNVVWTGCAVEIFHVARAAISRRSHELTIDMAPRAGHAEVCAGQRELRESIVIERRRIPSAGGVASLASRREAGLRMRRIVGFVEVRHVAAVAGGRRVVEFPSCVAGSTIQRGVCARQREAGEFQVIKLRANPIVHRMALFARSRQTQSDVVDADGLGAGQIFLVAGDAGRRKALELTYSSAGVALIAIKSGMCTDEREAVQVLVDLLDRNIPSLDGVALLAISAHLALVNVGVAIRALHAHVAEDRFGVALRAADAFVHPAERVLGCVVIEFRNGADRLPTAQGMAVLTGDAEASVRATRGRGTLRLSAGHCCARENRQSDHKMQKKCRSQGLPQPFIFLQNGC